MLLSRRAHLRSVRCRNDNNGAATTTSVVSAPSQDRKIQETISSLDALLGEQAQPKVVSPPPRPAAAQPAAANQAGVFNWPAGDSKKTNAPKPVVPAAQRRNQKSFDDVMAFEGLAPEIINARCAMIGFLMAFSTEVTTGQSVYSQLVSGGLGEMLLVILGVTLASFAPVIRQMCGKVPLDEVFNKNAKKVKAFGPFAPDAELYNGRAAMMGLAVIILLEGTSGAAFFL